MSTLAEIMAAVDALPKCDQRKVYSRLTRRLAPKGKKKAQTSAHDLMKDGCGIVDSGIRDLNNKKKHLKQGQGKKAEPSLYDLMKDACGIVDSGISDLSNKKKWLRLKGYGR